MISSRRSANAMQKKSAALHESFPIGEAISVRKITARAPGLRYCHHLKPTNTGDGEFFKV